MLFTRLLRAARVPSLCAVCRGWGSQRVCAECVGRFAAPVPRCRRCALQVPAGVACCGACLTDPPPCARTLAAVDYDHPWDGLITHFKFHDALDLAPVLAARMLAARGDAPAPALLVPIPLSAARLRERGYNQAWELAKRLGAALDCPTDPTLLLRVKDTPHQLAFPPAQRAGNVRAAFALEPRRRGELAGCSVTLVDDVMTTGATLAEAARTLLQAGAGEVNAWVVARTPRPDAQP
ncbi:MAG TPA: ComF family protein [Burkholderiaceae bacterium]|nr:ComF family protein [Burkholderiaceae bacterium]